MAPVPFRTAPLLLALQAQFRQVGWQLPPDCFIAEHQLAATRLMPVTNTLLLVLIPIRIPPATITRKILTAILALLPATIRRLMIWVLLIRLTAPHNTLTELPIQIPQPPIRLGMEMFKQLRHGHRTTGW